MVTDKKKRFSVVSVQQQEHERWYITLLFFRKDTTVLCSNSTVVELETEVSKS